MYYGSVTVDRIASRQAASRHSNKWMQQVPSGSCMCIHQMAALFYIKLCHRCHLESATSIENPTPTIDEYDIYLKNNPDEFNPNQI